MIEKKRKIILENVEEVLNQNEVRRERQTKIKRKQNEIKVETEPKNVEILGKSEINIKQKERN